MGRSAVGVVAALTLIAAALAWALWDDARVAPGAASAPGSSPPSVAAVEPDEQARPSAPVAPVAPGIDAPSPSELGFVPPPEPEAVADDRQTEAVAAADVEPTSWPPTAPGDVDAAGGLAAAGRAAGDLAPAGDTASELPSPTEMEAHVDEVIVGDDAPRGTEGEAHADGRRPGDAALSFTEADPGGPDDATAREPAAPVVVARGRIYDETRTPDPVVPVWRGADTVTTP
ncbi:MAG: hypothetical protein H6706_18450 [Myxococcales bacterium]|nr:hypothetical protein [Myxococcales bacterium]